MRLLRIFLLVALAIQAELALAVEPDEMLADPALEARAREISRGLRCVVCQNENIDSSAAPLARDLRLLVRERLKAGDTDREVIDHIVARYGDFVLLRPPLRPSTLILWFGPLLFLLIGGGLAVYFFRNAPPPEAARPALSPEERRRLDELLAGPAPDRQGEA